ncbi:MAG: hypothetical protein RLZZ389_251, partial [Actinomycetota bacterium]
MTTTQSRSSAIKGILGTKLGMTQVFDSQNKIVPVTVIEAGPCVVTQIRTLEKDGYTIHRMPVDKAGRLNLESYKKLLSDEVAIVNAPVPLLRTKINQPCDRLATGGKVHVAAPSTQTKHWPRDASTMVG